MPRYTQTDRPLRIFTPLGTDALLPIALDGHEGVSQMFEYRFDLLAEKAKAAAFDQMIGQEVRGELHLQNGVRHFHGIVTEICEIIGDDIFLQYRVTVAPALWRLTKRVNSRIFQDKSVVDILKEVLTGLKVRFQVIDHEQPRNFCAQYYETDFTFISRLMEEEGLVYYFEQGESEHSLVITDQPTVQGNIAGGAKVPFQSGPGPVAGAARVTAWKKSQQLCSGKFTVWDYNFQMPDKHLEATYPITDAVAAGTVRHRLDCGRNQDLETFHFTGEFGGHADRLDATGVEQDSLQQLFENSRKYARLRMEREASQSLRVEGASTCSQFLPGLHFTLADAPPADGDYYLTRVEHQVRQTGYRSGEEVGIDYSNRFVAVPKQLPYRAPSVTPRPRAHAMQPAVVVGPKGEEIFTDKFGRVKVQFLWDREGKQDAHSSCWIRVAQAHAGKGFGFISLPRIGEEVLVGFAGDNPDRPVIMGRMYNAKNLPPFELPAGRSRSGLKSHSVSGNAQQFSGLAIDDRLDQEHVEIHSQRHLTQSSEGALLQWVGGEHQQVVGGSSTRVTGFPPALRKTPAQPAGSGAGGGGTAFTDTQTVFTDADIQFGWISDGVVGVQSEIWLGSHIETTINPIGGLATLFSQETPFTDEAVNNGIGVFDRFGSKFWTAFTSAHTEVTIGAHPQIQHGMGLEYTRGPTVEGNKGEASALSKIWGGLYSLVALTVDLAVPLAELWAVNDQPMAPTTTTPSLQGDSVGQVAAKEGIAEVGKLVMDAMLAVWIGIEMKEQAGEVESVVAAQEKATAEAELKEASKLQAEALITVAENGQRTALKRQVRDLLTRKEGAKLQQEITTLQSALTKTCDGLYSVIAPSMTMSVKGKANQAATLLRLEAMASLDDPEQKASVKVWGDNLAMMQTKGGAQVEVGSGAVGDADLGEVVVQSGREGAIKLKMAESECPHALILHKDGIKIFSRDGGIHIQHGASAAFADVEAAAAPRKIVIESGDAPVEIKGDRVVIKADVSLRLECGANFIELNEAGIVQNGITTTTAADAAFMELASIQLDTP